MSTIYFTKIQKILYETNAYFAENILSNKNILEYLVKEKPKLADRILSFFKKASSDYEGFPRLSKAARSYYKTYKKLFDEFSERNFQNNATEAITAKNSQEVQRDRRNNRGHGERFALDIENFDISCYNEIKLSTDEQGRIQSEALTWDAKRRNEIRTRTLANGVTYQYLIDDDGIVHVYAIEDARNIHEGKNYYVNTDREEFNKVTESLQSGYGDHSSNNSNLQDGPEETNADRRNNIPLRPEGRGNRAGDTKNVSNAERGAETRIQGAGLKVVHTFTDISGVKRKVLKVGKEFMIEGNNNAKYSPTIEDAVRAENNRVINRYARKHNKTAGWVKQKLSIDSEFLKKERKSGTFTHEIFHTIDMLTGYEVRHQVEHIMGGNAIDDYDALESYLKSARKQGKIDGRTTDAEETAQMVLHAFYADRDGLRKVAPELVEILEGMGLDKYSHLAKNYNEYLEERKATYQVPTFTPDISYTLDDFNVDKSSQRSYAYSKEQYDSFGWVREANAMTKNELDDLYSKIQEKSTLRSFKRNSNGEAIVEVNNEPHANLAVDNVFAFVTGTKNKFSISKVIRFDADTATEMEILKEVLYDGGSWSDYYCSFLSKEGIAREYRKENFGSFEQYQRKVRRRNGGQESRGVDQSNREREEHGGRYHQDSGADGEVTPSVRKRYALDIDTVLESTKGSVMLNVDQAYKPNVKDKVFSGWTATKIAFVNEQAG